MENMELNDLDFDRVNGGCFDNHQKCCACGTVVSEEGHKTRCLKYRSDTYAGGDDRYHYFCEACISKLKNGEALEILHE